MGMVDRIKYVISLGKEFIQLMLHQRRVLLIANVDNMGAKRGVSALLWKSVRLKRSNMNSYLKKLV